MYTIKSAHYLGVVEKNGTRYAQVAVQSAVPGQPEMLAHFTKKDENQYEMPLLLENHADLDIDWYENNLHNAFVNITSSENSPTGNSSYTKDLLGKEILSYGDVRDSVRNGLG
ncbi:hypothetical protein SY83_13655 [Paenibacillus swuensis]|uniref:Uncharacterized protein n=1 Tax=Paenibacillus swuensis TaxID=1178515 RepID=A0A172TJP4_9BACL|nr:hypothetical protein [Paenibacillus swuensis]ANE47134.1 hypothetical protein SY83_13655 [Paenibacillus swuensis]